MKNPTIAKIIIYERKVCRKYCIFLKMTGSEHKEKPLYKRKWMP